MFLRDWYAHLCNTVCYLAYLCTMEVAMPWTRYKLMPESKLVKIQKRWFRWPIPWWKLYFHKDYMRLDTPINMMKEKCVELEDKVMRLRMEIEIATKKKDAIAKHLKNSEVRDTDGGGLTQWKFERQPHFWNFSIFQLATPFVMEPPEFDNKLYRLGGRGRGAPPKRPKDWQVDVDSLKKGRAAHSEEMAGQREMTEGDDDKDLSLISFAAYYPGRGDKTLHQRQGEKKTAFKQRQEDNKGKIEGID